MLFVSIEYVKQHLMYLLLKKCSVSISFECISYVEQRNRLKLIYKERRYGASAEMGFSWPRGYKTFPCSTQLSMNFFPAHKC